MRVIIGIGSGIAASLLFLIQTVGVVQWCPPWLFVMLHFPSTVLAFALSQGAFNLGMSPSPYGVVLQWTSLGTLVGVILHLKHRSQSSPSEIDSDQGQSLGSVPKSRFSIVRVICVIVGLLFLFSLLLWAWVLSTPRR